jgi:hypothetical protein
MQLSPHALPARQTLQQPACAIAAPAPHALNGEGAAVRNAAASNRPSFFMAGKLHRRPPKDARGLVRNGGKRHLAGSKLIRNGEKKQRQSRACQRPLHIG